MKFLWILLAVLAVLLGALIAILAVFLLIPARVRVKWDGSLSLWAGAGPVTLRLLPQKPRKPKKSKKPATAAPAPREKPKAKVQDKPQKPPRKALKLDFDTILAYIKIGSTALGRMLRAIRISRLKLHAVISAEDPSTTALAYGGAAAALNGVLPLIEKNVVWHNTDIFIEADFSGKAEISLDVTISALPVVMLIAAIRLYFEFRKINKSKPLERVK